MSETIHVPVMPREVIDGLNICEGDTVVDATLGGGGHALLALERLLPGGTLFACDQDGEAVERFRVRLNREAKYADLMRDGRVVLIHTKFSDIGRVLRDRGVSQVSAIFADLGLSSDQLQDADRGFSFLYAGPLDMRFDRSEGVSAADIVNGWSEQDLSRIFREYGDVRDAGRIAKAIVRQRATKRFETTAELAECIRQVSRDRKSSIHPATTVFQALRMAVNRERESLETFLKDAIGILKTGGRIAVLSFHSGEERAVKRIFAEDARGCVCPKEFPVCRCGRKARLRFITKRARVPSDEEVRRNPRARSAKLRIAERV